MDGIAGIAGDAGNASVSDASGIGGASSDVGSGDDGIITIDPTSGRSGDSGGSASGGTGRRRGRPPGSGKTTSSGKAALDGIDIRVILVGIHGLLATKFGEHWTLEDDEAKQVESAIKRAMRHQEMQVSQKQIDYMFAAYVVAMVYGTRLMTQFVGQKNEAPETEGVSSAPVFQFPQPGQR